MQPFRHTVAALLLLGALAAAAPTAGRAAAHGAHGVILQYHHVDGATPAVTSITPERFADHLAYLQERDYQVWPLERLLGAVRGAEATPDRVVAITFDDAYTSIHDTALPLLKRYNYPFTLFVATDLVGSNDRIYLTWPQIRALRDQGGTIANHTRSHLHMLRKLPAESDAAWLARLRAELEGAEQIIAAETGQSHRLFAYPFGEYTREVKALVQELGYTALGQQSGPVSADSDPGALPRFPMSGIYSALDSLGEKLDTLPFALTPRAHDSDPLLPQGETQPTLIVELQPGDYSQARLACYATGQGAIPVTWLDPLRFSTRAPQPLPVGRSRYNCTMPGAEGHRYRWYSQLWIRRNEDGSWYAE